MSGAANTDTMNKTGATNRGESLADTLSRLAAVLEARKGSDPEKSYVARLFAKGDDAILPSPTVAPGFLLSCRF